MVCVIKIRLDINDKFILQPPQAQQAPLQIQPSIISQQAVAAAAAAAQQQYAAVPVSMVETGRQMLLTVSKNNIPHHYPRIA